MLQVEKPNKTSPPYINYEQQLRYLYTDTLIDALNGLLIIWSCSDSTYNL